MTVYLDISAVLRILLRQPKPLDIWAEWDLVYTSELLHVEACRVIDRSDSKEPSTIRASPTRDSNWAESRVGLRPCPCPARSCSEPPCPWRRW